ncbi:MAG: hypothetical protein OXQ29_16095 [Rhodospirillaceae bacterium]|nr:hypothetical protein [Rhodospirillaceae bacterium]
MAGEGLPLVGRLLGHSRHRTTAGYAHLSGERVAGWVKSLTQKELSGFKGLWFCTVAQQNRATHALG